MRRIDRDLEALRPQIHVALREQLQEHECPGNVRELRNVIDRALVLSSGDDPARPHRVRRGPQTVPLRALKPATVPPAMPSTTGPSSDLTPAELADRAKIVAALERCSRNQTRAAKVLGISHSTLATKRSIYRIPRPRK